MPTTYGQNVAQVLKLGPAQVKIGSNANVSFFSVKGATIKWSPKTTDAKVSKYGDTPVAMFYTGGDLTCEFEFAQTDHFLFSLMSLGVQVWGTQTSGAPGVGFGKPAGTAITGQLLEIKPENSAYNITTPATNYTFTMWLAVPMGEPELVYTTEGGENVYKAKFRALYDPSHDSSNNSPLGMWGNTSPT